MLPLLLPVSSFIAELDPLAELPALSADLLRLELEPEVAGVRGTEPVVDAGDSAAGEEDDAKRGLLRLDPDDAADSVDMVLSSCSPFTPLALSSSSAAAACLDLALLE